MQPAQFIPSNANQAPSRIARQLVRPAIIALTLTMPFLLTACTSTTLPWPDLSISKDEPDGALTKEEQDILKQLLADKQKNHKDEAVKEIENR